MGTDQIIKWAQHKAWYIARRNKPEYRADIMQEAVVKALELVPSIDLEYNEAQTRHWVMWSVARHLRVYITKVTNPLAVSHQVAAYQWKGENPKTVTISEVQNDAGEYIDVFDNVPDEQDMETPILVDQLTSKLNQQHRRHLHDHHVLGMTKRAIAEAEGVKETTMVMRFKKAYKVMKESA